MEKHVPAAVDFTRAMESKKKPDGLLLFLRGDCYNKLGLIDKAMDDYTKAAELNPKGANTFESMGQFDKALKDMDRILSLSPQDSTSYEFRAKLYDTAGQKELARKALLWAGSFPPPTVVQGQSADNRKASYWAG